MSDIELVFFNQLNERQKRLYVGLKSIELGYHGVSKIADEFGVHPHTIRLGQKELQTPDLPSPKRIRKVGGGRKKKIESIPEIPVLFDKIVEGHTAGSPMNEAVRWTHLSVKEIVQSYAQSGIQLTRFIVKQLFKMNGFVKRKMAKKGTLKNVLNRDEQFHHISQKKAEFTEKNLPILSIDTKKKEFIGDFYRDGDCYCHQSIIVHDHDFPSLAEGVVIPHGIFDITKNKGYITLGQSKDTSEFLVDNIKYHWQNYIQKDYKMAREVLLLMDGGGSNSCLHYIVKEDLQKLANELNITIHIAHYPAYCSKYNPIEHRLFPHVQRSWKGVVFKNYQIVKELVEKTTTEKGLKVTAWINEKVYETGRKYAEDFKENMTITFDKDIPKWNYQIKPL